MNMGAVYVVGVVQAPPVAASSYDRFHVIAVAIQVMDDGRREELRTEPEGMVAALLDSHPKTRRILLRGMRKNPSGWSVAQIDAMHWFQGTVLKGVQAWRLRMTSRAVYTRARQHNSAQQAADDLTAWTIWAKRCRLALFQRLAATFKARYDAVVRNMHRNCSNAFVESTNGQREQAKRAARGYSTGKNFLAITDLRLSRLKNLPVQPVTAATTSGKGCRVSHSMA